MSASRKNIEIERLRAVAIIMVFFSHLPAADYYLPCRINRTWGTGVDLFFVISGFVITNSFVRLLGNDPFPSALSERLKASTTSLKVFYLRRFFRIAPPALLWLGIYFLLSCTGGQIAPHLFGTPAQLLKEIGLVFSGLYNYSHLFVIFPVFYLGHYWSLTVEEHFYLLLPLMFICFTERKSQMLAVFAGILLVTFVFRTYIPMPDGGVVESWNNFSSHRRFDGLFMGVLLALWLNRSFTEIRGRAYCQSSWLSLLKTAPVVLLLSGISIAPILMPLNIKYNYAFSVYALCSMSLIYLASKEKGYILEFPLLGRFLEYVGSRSYSMYLAYVASISLQVFAVDQIAVSNETLESLGSNLAQTVVAFLVMTACAEITYRFVEKPMIAFGRSFIERRYFTRV